GRRGFGPGGGGGGGGEGAGGESKEGPGRAAGTAGDAGGGTREEEGGFVGSVATRDVIGGGRCTSPAPPDDRLSTPDNTTTTHSRRSPVRPRGLSPSGR